MAEVAKFPGPTADEIEGMKVLKRTREVGVECIEVLISIMRNENALHRDQIEAAQTLLYYAIQWECDHNG